MSSSSSQEMFVLRETHKYIFFGPSRKDVKNTYFEAVYLYEKKLKIQAGQKVLLVNHGKEPYGVALVGQAQNRQVWVWLVSFQTEDVVKRLIVTVADIVGTQSPEEEEMCKQALSRYQRKSSSYRAMLAAQQQQDQGSSGNSAEEENLAKNSPSAARRLRSHDKEPRPKRMKRPYNRNRLFDDEEEEEEDAFDQGETDSEEEETRVRYSKSRYSSSSPQPPTKRLAVASPQQLNTHRIQHGELFMTLLECVVMTLHSEYPEKLILNE